MPLGRWVGVPTCLVIMHSRFQRAITDFQVAHSAPVLRLVLTQHPNIVSFFGLCTLPPCILTGGHGGG